MNDFILGRLAKDRDEDYLREAERDRPAALLRASRFAQARSADAAPDRRSRTASSTAHRVHVPRHLWPHLHRPAIGHRP